MTTLHLCPALTTLVLYPQARNMPGVELKTHTDLVLVAHICANPGNVTSYLSMHYATEDWCK